MCIICVYSYSFRYKCNIRTIYFMCNLNNGLITQKKSGCFIRYRRNLWNHTTIWIILKYFAYIKKRYHFITSTVANGTFDIFSM